MIYLVKNKTYDGVPYTANKNAIDLLLSKGAAKKLPYSKPNWYKGTEEEYKEYYKNPGTFEDGYTIEFDKMLLNDSEFHIVFKWVEVIDVLNQDVQYHEVMIDLNALADKIMNKVIANSSHLFNSRLEVHQPNMPLFQYNEYTYQTDCCTERLQDEYIDKGWRVVCVCPQPDQRRPDYILGRYNKETL